MPIPRDAQPVIGEFAPGTRELQAVYAVGAGTPVDATWFRGRTLETWAVIA
jgi:hypothetical protein